MRYIPATETDRAEMCARIGIQNPEELFRQIPEHLQLKHPLNLPPALSEMELVRHMRGLMAVDTILAGEAKTFQDIITRYEESETFARAKMEEFRNNPKQERVIRRMDERFILRGVYKEEQKILNDLKEKEIITPKLGIILADEFAKEEMR